MSRPWLSLQRLRVNRPRILPNGASPPRTHYFGFDRVVARFDQLKAKFDQVDAMFDRIDAQLDELG